MIDDRRAKSARKSTKKRARRLSLAAFVREIFKAPAKRKKKKEISLWQSF